MNERQITPVTHQSNVPVGIFDPTTIETLNRFPPCLPIPVLYPKVNALRKVLAVRPEKDLKTVSEAEAVANCVIVSMWPHALAHPYGNAELVHCIWSPILVVQVPNCHYQYLWDALNH